MAIGENDDQASALNESAQPEALAGRDSRNLDLASLKVLAHPLRVQLLDVLSKYGPDTATGLAARLGESSGATSYHLRQLAKADFVREVPGRGTKRERWWERKPGGINLEPAAFSGSVAARTASDMVMRQWQQNSESALSDYLTHGLDVLEKEWVMRGEVSVANLRLTKEQLVDFTTQVTAVIDEFVTNYRTSTAPGSRPVQVQFNAFPLIDGEEIPS
ncbi:ArsR/SmtB family transcription factor [Rathayibacter soli]|uniref:ArsR/SmtB family transcription factor n=1 Tax=Rathayibacter soli TaxID=3144168 RepID=UPI0027E535F1|nr:helix-turn-helix domain-containing protein [Glaciibacter superstes]